MTSESRPNKARLFAEVLSVDAWHSQFDAGTGTADLFADVVFRQGQLGDEEGSPVSFKLAIRRAELLVVLPPNEPVDIVTSSVSRDEFSSSRQSKTTSVDTNTSERAKNADLTISSKEGPTLGLGSRRSSSASSRFEVEQTETSASVQVQQSKTSEGFYRWEMRPFAISHLEGRGWDYAVPRLRLKDRRGSTKSLPPSIRVQVRCRKEDLSITDLRLNNAEVWEKVKEAIGFNNRRAAAEAYIRNILMERGLDVGSLQSDLEFVQIADVMAEQDIE